MKRIYSYLLSILLLFATTACEDDYRSIVFFTGDAPIYQIGTCDNQLGSLSFYMTRPNGIVVGVDGGDGKYSVSSNDDAVATAVFVQSENGYQRILVTPTGVGNALITVRDGNGGSALLSVKVDECVKRIWNKLRESIAVVGNVTDEEEKAIAESFENFFTVKVGGRYELIPDDESNIWGGGVLRVYPDDTAVAPLVGRYDQVPVGENQRRGYKFAYGDEEHIFYVGVPDEVASTKMSVASYVDFWEDVTDVCPVQIPEGTEVYHIERLYIDYGYNGK